MYVLYIGKHNVITQLTAKDKDEYESQQELLDNEGLPSNLPFTLVIFKGL